MADNRLALESHAGDMDAPDGVTAAEWEATPASVKELMQRLALEVAGLRRELELVSRAYANYVMSPLWLTKTGWHLAGSHRRPFRHRPCPCPYSCQGRTVGQRGPPQHPLLLHPPG